MKAGKDKVALVVVTLALFIAVAYIGLNEYQKVMQDVYNQGALFGYQQAVLQLMQQVSTCQQVPIVYENTTLNVIAVECLQQAQESQGQ